MLRACVIAAALQAGVVAAGSAQSWQEAYQAGDYEKAAKLLYPIVTDPDATSPGVWGTDRADDRPYRALATMHAEGRGVQADPITACSLAMMAEMFSHHRANTLAHQPESYLAFTREYKAFRANLCGGLSQDATLAAGRVLGFFAFGMPETTFQVGPAIVRVGRSGVAVAEGTEEGFLDGAPVLVARVRPITIDPPENAAPGVGPRHFLELLAWEHVQVQSQSARRYGLRWSVYEVDDKSVELRASEFLDTSESWPRPALPADFDSRFHFEMIRSGHVRWRMDGDPPKRGWIMLPEGAAR
jgi:hypothetical protein